MPKFIRVDPPGSTYRLPAETDLAKLKDRIHAMVSGQTGRFELDVELGDDPRVKGVLILNAKAFAAVFVIETADVDDPPPVLDEAL